MIGAHILDGGEPLCNDSLFSVEEILTSGQSPLWQCDADADAGSVIGNGGGLIHVIAKDIECRSEELQRIVVTQIPTDVSNGGVSIRMVP